MPECAVIPELDYADVLMASDWLCDAFGFTVRLRVGAHRAQLTVGDGAVVVTTRSGSAGGPHRVMVRIDDVYEHRDRAASFGARILRPPTDYPYGERQYTVEDVGGHVWTFSQSIADVAPETWGGALVRG